MRNGKMKLGEVSVEQFCEILKRNDESSSEVWKDFLTGLRDIQNDGYLLSYKHILAVISPFICLYEYQRYLENNHAANDLDENTCKELWRNDLISLANKKLNCNEIFTASVLKVDCEVEIDDGIHASWEGGTGYDGFSVSEIFKYADIDLSCAYNKAYWRANSELVSKFLKNNLNDAWKIVLDGISPQPQDRLLEYMIKEDSGFKELFQKIEIRTDIIPDYGCNAAEKEIENCIKKNQQIIFTGAPGTGKTYSVRSCVKRLCKGNPKVNGESGENTKDQNEPQYQFVQFHPSYDYSDFVEGLRPVMLKNGGQNRNSKDHGQSGQAFVRVDGIFKKFCRRIVEENLDRAINYIIKLPADSTQEDAQKYREICCPEAEPAEEKENVHVTNRIKKEIAPESQKAKIRRSLAGPMCESIQRKAAGSYSPAENLFCWGNEEGRRNDFDGSMYYFIIDEINRADLSKVFGELMFGLEESYRGIENRFPTQYSYLPTYQVKMDGSDVNAEPLEFDCFKDGFFIPHNLCIIGTMNDIDRSVETFDFALRRRFRWIDIRANDIMETTLTAMWQGKMSMDAAKERAKAVTEKIRKMNGELTDSDNKTGLTEAYHIGPAYFKDYTYEPESRSDNLREIFEQKIEPLIREYLRGRNGAGELVEKCRDALLS